MIIYRPAKNTDYKGMLSVLETVNMHYIPSDEVDELNPAFCFVCTDREGKIIGMSGWKSIDKRTCKTTLMAVLSDHRSFGIGHTLQTMRMVAAYWSGHDIMITNADRPTTIEWYKRKFGYHETGKLPKIHEFGLPGVHEWTTLETNLGEFFRVN